jgi:transposase-like protein
MSKYTVDVKLKAVECYLTENESYKTIAESIGADKSQVITWMKLFEVIEHAKVGLLFQLQILPLKSNYDCSLYRCSYN